MVRAKFRVQAIKHVASYQGQTVETDFVELAAVTDDANKTWSRWTPSGRMEMQINNPDALNQFKVGQSYFIDFTEAPQAESNEK